MSPKFVYRWSVIHSIGAWILALLSRKPTGYFLEEHDRLCFLTGEILFVLVVFLGFVIFYL